MKDLRFLITLFIICSVSKISTAQLYLTTNGNVSIGSTVAPPSTAIGLFTLGDAMFSTATGSTASAPFIYATNGYSSATQADYSWWYDGSTGMYHPSSGTIGFTTSGSQIMGLTASGWGETSFLNWNTSTSNYPLVESSNVNCTTSISWNVYCNYTGYNKNTFYVYGTGDAWGKSWTSWSDESLKENVVTIPNALSKVLKLHGVNYTFISDRNASTSKPKLQMGVIAQEVEKVVPEVVSTGVDGLKGVQYSNLVPLLIEAMKEQNKRIDSLQSIIVNCCENNQLLNSTSSPSSNLVGAALYQNNPNPFTKETSITYFLPSTTQSASLMITDMDGKMLKSLPISSYGQGAVIINGGDFSAGMYYYTLIADGKEIGTKKMILTQ